MSKSKRPQIPNKNEVSLVRSSAAEYLTFVAATGNAQSSVEMRYEDENLWLTQKMMATLYDVSVPAISQHLKRIYADNELEREATVKQYLMVQTEGEREVQRKVDHYSLQAIIAVGFKIENERAVQFRKWANQIVKDYTIQGWVMDAERLKGGGSILTDEFFERQLEKVREIRASERKFYQKITDIYATSLDYDTSATATKRFFAAVQNKLHYAIHGQTAAEVIVDRADHKKEDMGLTSWEGAPQGKVHKYDVAIAKNYLSEFELAQMQRIVSAYLDMAELQAMRRIPMTMADWEERLGGFLKLWDREVLQDAGKVTAEIAKAHAMSEFEKYRIVQDRLFESDFDRVIKQIEADRQPGSDDE
ncbi:virulence RhuM family protein [Sulfuriferula sp.]|uniref:virulence RhuM family protein n=1 Tax=Sulfuriferula sp. TaxID=2025307 RepID=UPI0027307EAD|nr:virulence RhuM family protein [Sulfuriferula sp.]MDP2025703.1 virulence RhuM family protein [Sulfuriferula sp.]